MYPTVLLKENFAARKGLLKVSSEALIKTAVICSDSEALIKAIAYYDLQVSKRAQGYPKTVGPDKSDYAG